jgi:hypothetical protein
MEKIVVAGSYLRHSLPKSSDTLRCTVPWPVGQFKPQPATSRDNHETQPAASRGQHEANGFKHLIFRRCPGPRDWRKKEKKIDGKQSSDLREVQILFPLSVPLFVSSHLFFIEA